jgi:hypothetical protein
MELVEFMPDKLYDDPLPTEWAMHKHFKNRPLKADITYYAIPFSWLVHRGRLDEIPRKAPAKGGFSVFQADDWQMHAMIPTAHRLGLGVVFACAGQGQHYKGVRILPCPYVIEHKIEPSVAKDIWYSFIGSATHRFRERVFELKTKRSDVVIKKRTFFHYGVTDEHERQQLRHEYVDTIARSRFSLCPRGAASNSIRFWESLGAGAIPVVVPAEDLYLPNIFDWSSCIVAIPGDQLERVEEILSKITPQQEAHMRESCYRAFELFSGENLTLCIRKYYEEEPWDIWNPLGRPAPEALTLPTPVSSPAITPATHPAVLQALPKPKPHPTVIRPPDPRDTPIERMKKEIANLLAKPLLTTPERARLVALQRQLERLKQNNQSGI